MRLLIYELKKTLTTLWIEVVDVVPNISLWRFSEPTRLVRQFFVSPLCPMIRVRPARRLLLSEAQRYEFRICQPLFRLFENDGYQCFWVSVDISPNVHGDWEYVVDVKAQEASKRFGTVSRKPAIVIARKRETTAFNRDNPRSVG